MQRGRIFYWIGLTATQPFNTGVQRVARCLAKALLGLGYELVPVKFDPSKGMAPLITSEANRWRNYTIGTAIGLGVYAVATAFLHKWEWLAPKDTFQAVQLGLSKVIIFAAIAYMLLLCARNFLAHKHNSIVNKHRQNALLTFNALTEAAGNEERRDVILTYAAACIFTPQETGYTKGGSSEKPEMPVNIIQALPKLAASTASH